MSGFLPLEDLEPTLSDVLAFIDTFKSDTIASTTSTGSSDDGNAFSPLPPAQQSAVERRKTRKAAASRRCQQKKRAELLALRAQVTALESRLKELNKETRRGAVVGFRLDNSQRHSVTQLWRDKARLEHQLRLQSEQRNRQLLAVVARQSTVAKAVRDVLCNVVTVVNIEEGLRTPSPTNTPSVLEGFVPNLHDAIYGELSARIGRLYTDVSKTFTELDQIQITDLSTGAEVKRDAATGMPYVELTSAMTMNLGLREAERLVWTMKSCHNHKQKKYFTELGVKKESELELRDEEMAIALSSLSLSRTYEEENRLMLTFSSLVSDRPTGTGMRFREEGFILVTKTPTSGTVLQSRCRLTPEIDSTFGSSSVPATQDTEATNLFVLQNLGRMMWTTMQSIQNNCTEAQLNKASIPSTC